MGPLERFDPVLDKLPGLTAVYGKPRRGLPVGSGRRIQRIGNQDKWCVEADNHLVVMEWNSSTGEMETREAMVAQPEWCLSPDGTKLFAYRLSQTDSRQTTECFDFQTGRSLWVCDAPTRIVDAIFNPAGTEVMVLHAGKSGTLVSCYDAGTGGRKRQIEIPGEIYPASGDLMGVTRGLLYVIVPHSDNQSTDYTWDGWMIRDGSDKPVKLTIDTSFSTTSAQIAIGGNDREFVAIYSDTVVELFREENGALTRLRKIEMEGGGDSKAARFTPDHLKLFISGYGKTWVISTRDGSGEGVQEYKTGFRMFDFTSDGKRIVSVDDGGGVIRNRTTFEREDSAAFKKEPSHCCPIVDAGFSMNGRMIISNDEHRLILWTKEGEFLAELVSPNEKKHSCIEMQSPLFVDREMKVYAADGFDFLEWDLNEIGNRSSGPGGRALQMQGKPVFQERRSDDDDPDAMTISLDSSGKHLITATSTVFRVRPIETPEKNLRLLVPEDDIFMKPRYIYQQDQDPKILVASSGFMWMLDPAGKEKAVLLSSDYAGFDSKTRHFFQMVDDKKGRLLVSVPFGLKDKPDEFMPLPEDWKHHGCRLLVSKDSRWLVTCHAAPAATYFLAVIDWKEKRVVKSFPLNWKVTSMALSPDESHLLVGSANRCIYDFDFNSLRKTDE